MHVEQEYFDSFVVQTWQAARWSGITEAHKGQRGYKRLLTPL